MQKLLRLVAATAISVGFTGAVAAAQSGDITGPTGPDSNNKVYNTSTLNAHMYSSNSAGVVNGNGQLAASGNVKAHENTTVGDVGSGNAGNTNDTSTTLDQSNSNGLCGCLGVGGGSGDQSGSISGPTGPDSNNQVTNKSTVNLDVKSKNTASVVNLNFQGAFSGSASASDNTTVGNVTSGDAMNSNTTSTSISQSN